MTLALDLDWYGFDALTTRLLHDILRLRQEVFVVEQTCPFPEIDGRDPDCEHGIDRGADGSIRAYLRLVPPGPGPVSLGRILVAPACRGLKLGRPLVQAGIDRVLARYGAVPIKLGAQAHLQQFYGALGFDSVGAPYVEDGIPHIDMIRP